MTEPTKAKVKVVGSAGKARGGGGGGDGSGGYFAPASPPDHSRYEPRPPGARGAARRADADQIPPPSCRRRRHPPDRKLPAGFPGRRGRGVEWAAAAAARTGVAIATSHSLKGKSAVAHVGAGKALMAGLLAAPGQMD